MAKTQKKRKIAAKPVKRKGVAPAVVRAGRAASAAPARGKLERVRMPRGAAKPVRAEAPPSEDANEGKYVYCIIKSEQQLAFGPLGIGADPAEVHTVHYQDIAAV